MSDASSASNPAADNESLDDAPAPFFDLQVNGFGGVDFNQDDLDPDALHDACQRLRDDGVDRILATVITADLDRMAARLRRLVDARTRDDLVKQVIAGLHVEGPFINETDGYRGAHPAHAVMPAAVEAMERLLDAADGLTRVVTLAPERDAGLAVTRHLANRDVIVSAGHCNPTLDELDAAIDAGLSMFTHLGNGCPMQLHRHDNVIQRVLSRADRLWLGFIADGAHVAWPALGNYLRCAGLDRCVVVSDAIMAAGLGPGRFQLNDWDLRIGDDLVARAPDGSHLVGSAIPLSRAARNLVEYVGLTHAQARQLTSTNPRRVLQEVE